MDNLKHSSSGAEAPSTEHLPFFGCSPNELTVASDVLLVQPPHSSDSRLSGGGSRLLLLPAASTSQRQLATGYRAIASYKADTHIILIDLQLSAGNDDIFIIRLFYRNILGALQVAVHFIHTSREV